MTDTPTCPFSESAIRAAAASGARFYIDTGGCPVPIDPERLIFVLGCSAGKTRAAAAMLDRMATDTLRAATVAPPTPAPDLLTEIIREVAFPK